MIKPMQKFLLALCFAALAHAGEKSDFTVNYMINTMLQPLPGATH
jgi:hypothetical protein